MPLPIVPAPTTPTRSIFMKTPSAWETPKSNTRMRFGLSSRAFANILRSLRFSPQNKKARFFPKRARRVSAYLFPVQTLVNHHLTALLHRNHFVQVLEPGHGDVNLVVARIQIEFRRRHPVHYAIVHRDLRPFGLGSHTHHTHSRRVRTAKHFLEFPPKLDVIGVSQRPQCRRELESLADLQVGAGGFIQIPLLPEHKAVTPRLVDWELRRCHFAGVFAVHPDRRSRRITVY